MLGLAERKRRTQELPFGRADVSTRFVIFVIIMMTMLATLALGGAQMIMTLRGAWVSDLQGQISIEVSPITPEGYMRPPEDMALLVDAMHETVSAFGDVDVMSQDAVAELIKPWLGDVSSQEDLPLPAIIGLSAQNVDMTELERLVGYVDSQAIIDTHQGWVKDLRRFSGVLLGASGFMALMVVLCAMLCVSGAVRAQLASHKADIDLLHLMGASDQYIGSQFVRVVARDVGYAAFWGLVGGLVLLFIGRIIAGNMQDIGFSEFSWNGLHLVGFALLPVVITGLCFVTARRTVLLELQKMP